MQKILVIDDDETIRDVLNTFLTAKGFHVCLACDGDEGIELLRQNKFDIVLTDIMMPKVTGIDVLKEMSVLNIKTPVIVITAYASIKNAVQAMKMGAFDYVTKPFNLEELLILIQRAISISKLVKENKSLKLQLKGKYSFNGIVGVSPQMQDVYDLIEKIADTDSTILITGESGTGKEVIAKTIHYNSSRSDGPFVPINCAAIPKDLLESEMFGHEKGAFTGALNTRLGRFELANTGTLFLDEIGELDPSLQVKLLRVVQEKEFERVGGVKTIKTDVRIIAATNKDLEKEVKEGRFREDLYYRLNVIPIHLPPLRERIDDIPILLEHFIHEFCKKRKRQTFRFSMEATDALKKYSWPGNVRELENLIERLSILFHGDTVRVSDLPDKIRQEISTSIAGKTKGAVCSINNLDIPSGGISLNSFVEDIERRLIISALDKTGWIKSRAAELLGLNRTTLIEKMKKMGISDKTPA